MVTHHGSAFFPMLWLSQRVGRCDASHDRDSGPGCSGGGSGVPDATSAGRISDRSRIGARRDCEEFAPAVYPRARTVSAPAGDHARCVAAVVKLLTYRT